MGGEPILLFSLDLLLVFACLSVGMYDRTCTREEDRAGVGDRRTKQLHRGLSTKGGGLLSHIFRGSSKSCEGCAW